AGHEIRIGMLGICLRHKAHDVPVLREAPNRDQYLDLVAIGVTAGLQRREVPEQEALHKAIEEHLQARLLALSAHQLCSDALEVRDYGTQVPDEGFEIPPHVIERQGVERRILRDAFQRKVQLD